MASVRRHPSGAGERRALDCPPHYTLCYKVLHCGDTSDNGLDDWSLDSRLQNDRQVEKSQTGQARMPKPSEFAILVIALVTGGDPTVYES